MGARRVLTRTGAAAAAGALLLGGVAMDSVFAQGGSATPTSTPTAAARRVEDFLDALAAGLGKSPAEVRAAFKAAEHGMVNRDVQAGLITPDQAAMRHQRIDQARVTEVIDDEVGDDDGDWAELADAVALARFLGAEPMELRLAQRAAKSLAQVAQEHGKTRDQLKSFLTQQKNLWLDQAVQIGRLTQQRADRRRAEYASRLDRRIDRIDHDFD